MRRANPVSVWLLLALFLPVLAACEDEQEWRRAVVIVETGAERIPFDVEIADTREKRAQGLMFRRDLPRDAGMLFLFDRVEPASFWMKNTYISLDLLFIDRDGRISHIAHEAEPLSTASIRSRGPVQAVLEINGGEARRRGIEVGHIVRHPALGTAKGRE
jgi:uncharacterized membrane protein (UPF0127 family)